MRKHIVKMLSYLLIMTLLIATLSACGKNDQESVSQDTDKQSQVNPSALVADESYFEWEGNLIVALTEKGANQESIKIPARCEGFSGAVFENSKVKTVVFEDNDNIELDFAFMGTETLEEVILPENLVTIPSMSFQMCTNLKSVVIPTQISEIGNYAFNACTSLGKVEFAGSNLTIIGANSFEDCKALREIIIPDSVITIEKYAFFNCSSLENVTLGKNISTFAKYAFGNTAITEIFFPEELQIEIMDAGAFGTNAYASTVYIVEGSWCDTNKDAWDIGFKEIKYK